MGDGNAMKIAAYIFLGVLSIGIAHAQDPKYKHWDHQVIMIDPASITPKCMSLNFSGWVVDSIVIDYGNCTITARPKEPTLSDAVLLDSPTVIEVHEEEYGNTNWCNSSSTDANGITSETAMACDPHAKHMVEVETCKDKTNFLIASEDEKKHCLKFKLTSGIRTSNYIFDNTDTRLPDKGIIEDKVVVK